MLGQEQDWAALCRDYRLRHGLKQEAMAQDFHVDQSTVSRWERGLREPSMQVKQAILNDLVDDGRAGLDQSMQLLLEMSGSAVALWDRSGVLRGCTPRFERELARVVLRASYRDGAGSEILGQHGNALLEGALSRFSDLGFFDGRLRLAVLRFAPVQRSERIEAGGVITASSFPVQIGPDNIGLLCIYDHDTMGAPPGPLGTFEISWVRAEDGHSGTVEGQFLTSDAAAKDARDTADT